MRSADILHLLREMIVALSPGDRLPAERDLAHRLKCSRQTVRAGLDVLKRDGLIWRHVGQGTFVGQRPRHLPGRPVMGGDVSPEELLRARLVLEPPIGAEAARCASDTDVGYLKQLIADGREATRHADCERARLCVSPDAWPDYGKSRTCGSNGRIVGSAATWGWQRSWDRSYRRLAASTFQTTHSDKHQHIVKAIAAGDEAAASRAMTTHLMAIQDAFGDDGR